MLNDIKIHGYLGKSPELKEYRNAKGETGHLVNFSVGVSRDNGDETDWFNCTAFGKRAEVIEKFFDRGSQIIVWGRMQSNKGKDDKTYWNLNVEGFDFCDKKSSKSTNQSDSWQELEEDNPFL